MAARSIAAVDQVAYSVIPPYMQDKILESYEAFEKEKEEGKRSTAHAAQVQPMLGREPFSIRQATSNAFVNTIRDERQEESLSPSAQLGAIRKPNSDSSPREVWNAALNPPRLVMPERSDLPAADAEARVCYSNMGTIDTFFKKQLLLYPVNNASKLMRAYVHYPKAFNNACWISGRESIFFGDVDPKIFNPLVNNLGVTTHEFGHAVTHYSGNLRYKGQSGALNESISDVFAIAIKHYYKGVAADSADADWLIGEDLVVNSAENGTALRSMSAPGSAYNNHPILGSDPQGGHMRDYQYTQEDNGGVHLNSGIPNHAFCLAASKIGGPTWKTAQIWFEALRHTEEDDFATFAKRTLIATKDLGRKEPIYNIVAKAWRDVGVDLRSLREEGKRSTPSEEQGFLQEVWNSKEMVEERGKFVTGMVVLGIAYTIFKAVSWLNKK